MLLRRTAPLGLGTAGTAAAGSALQSRPALKRVHSALHGAPRGGRDSGLVLTVKTKEHRASLGRRLERLLTSFHAPFDHSKALKGSKIKPVLRDPFQVRYCEMKGCTQGFSGIRSRFLVVYFLKSVECIYALIAWWTWKRRTYPVGTWVGGHEETMRMRRLAIIRDNGGGVFAPSGVLMKMINGLAFVSASCDNSKDSR